MGPTVQGPSDDQLRNGAQLVLDRAVAAATTAYPTVEVVGLLQAGQPTFVLLEASEHALVIAVGASGLDSFTECILGSVTTQIVTHASCPVAVVGADQTPGGNGPDAGKVVVGIDGSELSVDAARAGFEAASLRNVGLTLLHAWHSPAYVATRLAIPQPLVLEEARQEDLRSMAETVAGFQESYPDVVVEQRLVQGKPAKVLAEATRGAELIVVGTRGHGGFARLLLGSTSNSLLHHAQCPVLVVRPGTLQGKSPR
jgi:nucleotide-binding universal stress UspA family protein